MDIRFSGAQDRQRHLFQDICGNLYTLDAYSIRKGMGSINSKYEFTTGRAAFEAAVSKIDSVS